MREQEVLAALAELVKLHALPHHTQRQDDFVIVLGSRDPNYYSQCFFQDEHFWCEAVSNYYLDPQHALGKEQTSRLVGLGWNPPTSNVPNWSGIRRNANEVAALVVTTLDEVYGVNLDTLEVRKGWVS